jgi:UDP-N-acetylmuramoyl-tripeptide--D-alanyl-D-alanine ligase
VGPALNVEEIIRAAGAEFFGDTNIIFRGISTDSRSIAEGNLFVALTGEKFDGHDFLDDVLKKGAAGIVVGKDRQDKLPGRPGINVFRVDDTLKALGDIANFWRNRFTAPVIAITGSSGKTTTKEMAAAVISQARPVLKTEGNFNNLIGLPLTIFRMSEEHEAAILEMGTSFPGEIARLTEIARPDVGLITNIGEAHLQGLKSLDAIRKEKTDLFRVMNDRGIAIVNADDPSIMMETRWRGSQITFGIKNNALIRAERIRKEREQGVCFVLKIGDTSREIAMRVLGEHHIYNALAAAACAWSLGISRELICQGLMSFKPVGGRMEIIKLANGAFLLNDSYNANPMSVRGALAALKDLKGESRSVVVLGDMLELGDESERLHETVGNLIAETGVDRVILKGDYSGAVKRGAVKGGMEPSRISIDGNPESVADEVCSATGNGDWVLVKGSRGMRMEETIKAIIRLAGTDPGRDSYSKGESV